MEPEPEENFFDRKNEVTFLMSLLDAGKHVLVTGPRGVGKTSLLLYIYHSLSRKKMNVHFFHMDTDHEDTFLEKLRVTNRNVVYILDNFEKVSQMFSERLRATVGDAVLLLAGSPGVKSLFTGPTQPLYRMFEIVELANWDEEQVNTYLKRFIEGLENVGKVREGADKELFRMTGGAPMALALVREAVSEIGDTIDIDAVGLRHLEHPDFREYDRTILSQMSDQQKTIYSMLSRHRKNGSVKYTELARILKMPKGNVSKQLSRLVIQSLVSREKEGYRVNFPLLSELQRPEMKRDLVQLVNGLKLPDLSDKLAIPILKRKGYLMKGAKQLPDSGGGDEKGSEGVILSLTIADAWGNQVIHNALITVSKITNGFREIADMMDKECQNLIIMTNSLVDHSHEEKLIGVFREVGISCPVTVVGLERLVDEVEENLPGLIDELQTRSRFRKGTLSWLHLSDLGFRVEEETQGKLSQEQGKLSQELLNDIRETIGKHELVLDMVMVTGNIASSGKMAEYDRARDFFDELRTITGVSESSFFFVPGNHDVDRTFLNDRISRGILHESLKDREVFRTFMKNAGAEELGELFGKFRNYSLFVRTWKGRRAENETHWYAEKLKERDLTILGLNSAILSCGDDEQEHLHIGQSQINHVIDDAGGPSSLIIALLHHPLDWFRDSEGTVVSLLEEHCDVILHGHTHGIRSLSVGDKARKDFIDVGVSTPLREGLARKGYCFAKVNFESREIELFPRRRARSRWVSDRTMIPDMEKNSFGLKLSDRSHGSRFRGSIPSYLRVTPEYKQWIERECLTMEVSQLVSKGEVIRVGLSAVYIPLMTENIPAMEEVSGENGVEEACIGKGMVHRGTEFTTVDVEELIGREDYLLLEGDPGAGKTTMMRHLARSILRGERLPTYLPVLIYLRDMNRFSDIIREANPGPALARKLIKGYFTEKGIGFTAEAVEGSVKEGKTLFLLDGLDELGKGLRDKVVGSFCQLRSEHEGTKLVVATRPHAVEEAVTCLGDKHRKIKDLTMEQKEAFVHKWFEHLHGKYAMGKLENADTLIAEMRARPKAMDIVTTPLILTGACILYMDEERLPEQRADLHNRIIENLVEKRFRNFEFHGEMMPDMPIHMHRFLGNLALRMMKKKTTVIDLSEAEQLLCDFFPNAACEAEDPYRARIRELFEKIEPNTGFLTRDEKTKTLSFFHPNYQEFLAGRYLVHTGTDHWEDIREYVDDDWFREMVLLTLGFLSQGSPGWANRIIGNLLGPDEPPHRKILAAHGFLDLLPAQRDSTILASMKRELLSMMTSGLDTKLRFDAGEALGRLGDPRDLKEFVPIPGGSYPYQNRTKRIETFEIARYPVTNAWFDEFVRDGGYADPEIWGGMNSEGWKWKEEHDIAEPVSWHDRKWNCPNSPVVGVSWYEAKAFCVWLTRTMDDGITYALPTDRQWEAAARGKEGREYPWGDETDNLRLRMNDRGTNINSTSPAGMFPKGDTSDEISDMTGNVWEWCEDIEGSFRVLRGGSWFTTTECCRSEARLSAFPDTRYEILGFRPQRSL